MLFATWLIVLLSKLAIAQLPYDPVPIPNIWSFGQKMDLYIYANTEPLQNRFDDENELIGKVEGITFGETIKGVQFDHKFKDPPLYLHIHLIKAGIHPDPLKSPFDITNSIYRRHSLLRNMKRPTPKMNLLKPEAQTKKEKDQAKEKGEEQVPYWYPEVTINLVNHQDPIAFSTFPAYIRRLIYADRIRKAYFPIIYVNEFWELKARRQPFLDGSVKENLPLRIHFSTTSWFKFTWMAHFHQGAHDYEAIYGVNREFESVKRMLLETAPCLIALTVVISLLHVLFDFLAFKHDVAFWKRKTDLKGLSVRGVLINCLFQLVIFGYLLDSESSLMVLVSVGIGALIEVWKLTRVLQVSWQRSSRFPLLWLPVLQDRPSYSKSVTQAHDQAALRYLTAVSIPLLLAYSVWSLKYEVHKSWYSWVLRSLVGFVYTFGFIAMTPQLFINYKLKSVAYMPWKAFVYKTLNTFIDDLFAFVIKMPWMHRLACLRDDVLFFVYLYQLWAYPMDSKRPNEFNQTASSAEKERVKDKPKRKVKQN